ncbi:sulfur carrier protein ThiS [Micromonospora carbonacea]|uniref:Sulfur carrier protein ThiS n=1 Tax=Micromonospora carbonacea TaxID=47853 RepID=A0A1C4UGR6_9ACTN|nr:MULTISPECIES: sulfur carrier protein ThiS [Micromonospora]MBB5824295.1 sulfur carrier protein [Micromonospora carbonacea]MDG4815470.1 sulfur carrier protein ThiS [Micromonospora sp. WMMD956]QLD27486.1 sulfur carrier protein ThiS [Micromonospora carbonacea]WFE58030.1 sulfur carrier protein ThiS [Micromonospora sp. WMMD712]SCE70847.1 sulfur carrier protein ThiS [Micromonospora carbonacea]
MELTVNGTGRTLPAGATVADLVGLVTDQRRGLAVAVNGEVVPRGGWPGTPLRDGDHVEVLSAAQGG